MRIAICLSGLVRTYQRTFENFRNTVIEPNLHHQIDTFISTWPVEHSNNSMERTRRIAWSCDKAPPFPENPIDYHDLQNKYRPTTMVVEAPREFIVPWYVQTPGINIQSLMSMIYKIWSCDCLRRTHEQFEGWKYDAVIRMRFDSLMSFPLIITEETNLNALMVPSMAQARIHPDFDWTNDKFAMGNSSIITKYCDWFFNLEAMVKRGIPIQPEIMLYEHLREHGVTVCPWGTEMELVRAF